MKRREVFLIIPTFIFTKCTFIVIQLTLEIRLNPKLFKSTILTPTFSYKAEVKVAENASRWLERRQVVVSILPLLADVQRLPTAPASPGRAPKPSLAKLRSGPYRARGWQKG